MPRYQIEYNHGGGSKSWSYFDVLETSAAPEIACEKANETLKKDKENAIHRSFGYFKPLKTLTVKEYSQITKAPLRGGHKFKLRLTFLELVSDSGRKERFESYEYND